MKDSLQTAPDERKILMQKEKQRNHHSKIQIKTIVNYKKYKLM